MARPLRIEYENALFHVISRGDNRRKIVWDNRDRQKRLEWLERTVVQHGWRLHAFCLMTNHEHLFVQTPLANLGQGMKLLNACYTQYINKRHRRSGHLFQGRYKGHLVDQQGYFAALSRYIHLNPVRAKMVEDPADYAWSRFPGYARAAKKRSWVTYDEVLAAYRPGSEASRRRRYAAWVRAGVAEPPACPWSKLKKAGVIGGEDFVAEVRKRMAWVEKHPGVPETEGWIDRPELEAVVAAAAGVLNVDRAAWSEGRRSDSADRALVATLCERAYGYRGKAVAEVLGYRSTSSVAAGLERVEGSAPLMKAYRRLVRLVGEEFGG